LEEVQKWKVEKEINLFQFWHQRPYCKKMS
jgi:hypothetical protein